jgi:hypothetical protein
MHTNLSPTSVQARWPAVGLRAGAAAHIPKLPPGHPIAATMSTSQAPLIFEELVLEGKYEAALALLASAADPLQDLAALTWMERGRALDAHRALCACVRDACDFSVSFERSFAHREALLGAGTSGRAANAGVWAIATLTLTLFSPPNVKAAVAALRRLGSSLHGRSVIGKGGGVAALLQAWRMYPDCLAIVEALVVLCSGHVDNVSRLVREDGIERSLSVCGREGADPALKKEVLLLLGICCVCVPDEGRGDGLVDAVVGVLKGAAQVRSHASRCIAANALGVLANVGEAASRELYMTRENGDTPLPGYDVPDPSAAMDAILLAWTAWPKRWEIVSPAAWAFTSMQRASQIDFKSAPATLARINALLQANQVQSSSARALSAMANPPAASAADALTVARRSAPSRRATKRKLAAVLRSPRKAPNVGTTREYHIDVDCSPVTIAACSDDEGDRGAADEGPNFDLPVTGQRRSRVAPRNLDRPVLPGRGPRPRRSARERRPAKHGDGSPVSGPT